MSARARDGCKQLCDGDPDTIRTCDLQIRNLPLYPAELRGRDGILASCARLVNARRNG